MEQYLIAVNHGGGFDGVNMVSMRDAISAPRIQTLRQGAPANVLDYTEALVKTANTTAGSAVLSSVNTTSLTTGMLVYGDKISRRRKLTISSIDTTNGTVTLSGVVTTANTGTSLTFATATQLFKMNELPDVGKNYGLHFTQTCMADLVNVKDTVENANQIKCAFISNIAPLRKKQFLAPGQSLFTSSVRLVDGTSRLTMPGEAVPSITSHNDQTSVWLTNRPEGSVKGWGGGIADTFLDDISGTLNLPMATVSISGSDPFVAGTNTSGFLMSNSGLVRRTPGVGVKSLFDENATVDEALAAAIKTASQLVDPNETNNFVQTGKIASSIANIYQDVLLNAMEMTDPVNVLTPFFTGGSTGTSSTPLSANFKQLARLIHLNSPNRGANAVRAGNVVTVTTQKSNGTASRVASSTSLRIESPNHGLFTSTLNTLNTSDSIVLFGDTVSINTTAPVDGYKVTLDPLDPDNAFTVVTADTGALTGVAVNFRLKHNLNTLNKVYVREAGFDTTLNGEGYPVKSVVNNFTYTLETIATGAYPGNGNFFCKPKLINVPKMVLYTGTPGMSWDSHTSANHAELFNLNHSLTYFISLLSRIQGANFLVGSITEFGRTVTCNNSGTDHGYGNYAYLIGKDVKGNKMHGTPIDLSEGSPHITFSILFPTTSVYQYTASISRWLGATDAEVLALFPDLINWPVSERYLDILK